MLSPEEIQAARQQYGLGTSQQTGSSFGSGAPVDHSARMARLRGLASKGTTSQPQQEGGSFFGDVGQALQKTGSGLKQAFEMAPGSVDKSGGWLSNLKQTAEAGLQGVGSVAGGLNEIVGSAIHRSGADKALKAALKIGPVGAVWDKLSPEDQKHVTEGISHLAGGAGEEYNAWKQEHPEAARNVENIWQIAQAVPTIEGGAAITKAAPGLVKAAPEAAASALEKVGAVGSAAKESLAGVGEKIAPSMAPEIEQMGAKLGIDTKDKAFQEALDATKPTYGPKAKEAMIQAGKAKETGLLRTHEIMPTEADIKAAHAAKDIIDPKATGLKNVKSLNNEIGRISEEEIRPVIERNNAIYNRKQLESALKEKVSSAPGYADDPTVKSAYDRAVREMLVKADAQSGHILGAHDARIAFDKAESSIFPKTGDLFKDSLGKNAARDVRTAMNDFIDSHIPEGEREAFKAQRQLQSDLFRARNNIAKSSTKGIGKNIISRTLKAHPWLKTAAKLGGLYEGYHLFHELAP